MCRTRYVEFTNCHHKDPLLNKSFHCADHPCGQWDMIKEEVHTFCPSCLEHPRMLPKDPEIEAITALQLRSANNELVYRAQRVFDLAAEPGKGFRTFDKEMNNFILSNGINEPVYDAYNIHEFSGRLCESDEVFMHCINHTLRTYIQGPDTPDLTENQHRLYYQVVAAIVTLSMTKKESDLREELSRRLALVRCLNTILRPVRSLRAVDEPNCSNCLDPLDRGFEEPVGLPCNHVVGRGCIESWICDWKPGEPLCICLPCRDDFNLLTPLKLVEGIQVTGEDEVRMIIQPPAGWGINLLRAAWAGPV